MPLADRQGPVLVSLGGEFGGNKLVARNAEHGGEDALIPNAALAQLPFDHLLAAQDEFSFRGGCGVREAVAVPGSAVRIGHESSGRYLNRCRRTMSTPKVPFSSRKATMETSGRRVYSI